MENSKLSVEAIEQGTVIDHIPAGKGLAILRQFKLLHYGNAVTVGFNLPSKTQGSKDIIKNQRRMVGCQCGKPFGFVCP